ncbi:MAG: alpha/beta hydrolase [Treponema sp.]|jgi:acetyl esterase/lipase|nr:alpha/beta hydrolase [Treponema sp.]
MRRFIIGLLAAFCLSAAGCVSSGKAAPELHYQLYKDVSYGPHERNLIDISIPVEAAASQGVILFIHGGIWMYGGKENYPVFLDGFRDRFTVASMSHRYIDETTHITDLMDDVSAAVSFLRDFSTQNNANPGKLIIMGHSSGAHLAMLYAYQQYETSSIPIALCVSMAGPSDLGDIAFLYNFKKMGGEKFFYQLAEKLSGYHVVDGDVTSEGYSESGREMLAAISPLSFVSPDSPPTIIVHDAADTLVPYANSAALHTALKVYGVDHYFMASYSGIGHVLGAKSTKEKALRYDAALESWLVRIMNEYIEKMKG